jgi:hypothetical protein
MPSADTELTAHYKKVLTITAPAETVVAGEDYSPNLTKVTISGFLSGDTEASVVSRTNLKVTASGYNKSTSKIGDVVETAASGVTVNPAYAKKYVINSSSYISGKLTVVKGDGADTFIADVAKLPEASKATAADRAAVDQAKEDYSKLSSQAKALTEVVAAKKKLDEVETAVKKAEEDKAAADAVTALIDKLPSASKATSEDRDNLDAATAAYKKLTDAQKRLVPDADREKLAEVEVAVAAAEKADKAAADAVKAKINALPSAAKATAKDREALDEAWKAYNALTPAQKALLPGAENTLEAVEAAVTADEEKEEKDKEAADAVTALIDALPAADKATKEDRAAVDAAKEALGKLTSAQKEYVPATAIQKLSEVDEAVKKKESGDDEKAADEVAAMINALKGTAAGKGKAATVAARDAFESLTDYQKTLLPKSAESLLKDAEEAYTVDRTFQCGDNWYKVLPSGNVTYNRPADSACKYVTVPNQIKKNGYYYKVVKISIGAFKNCTALEWVVINKNIEVIGSYAFKNTPALTKIKVMTKQLDTGKVVNAFKSAGKNNGKGITVKTPNGYTYRYEDLFKGEGGLNENAKVQSF